MISRDRRINEQAESIKAKFQGSAFGDRRDASIVQNSAMMVQHRTSF